MNNKKFIIVAFIICVSGILLSCGVTNKPLSVEEQSDGSSIHILSFDKLKGSGKDYFAVFLAHPPKHSSFIQYYAHKYSCDSIVKRIQKKKYIEVYLFTAESSPEFPISESDKMMLKKLEPYISKTNSSYNNCIEQFTGYKLVHNWKRTFLDL